MRFPLALPVLMACLPLAAADPDYAAFTRILRAHYDPARGMDYEGLAGSDWKPLRDFLDALSKVDPAALDRPGQLAFYLNLYNATVLNLAMENRHVASIRDLSTDPFTRINVFKKDLVRLRGGALSLKRLEDEFIREGFKDPRIHFALNCAARSCPPLRREAYTGEGLEAQLDDQTRRFFADPVLGARFEEKDGTLTVRLTKIMDGGFWFRKDFDRWGGGRLAFLRRHLDPERRQRLDAYGDRVKLEFDAYDWSLNSWKR